LNLFTGFEVSDYTEGVLRQDEFVGEMMAVAQAK
jgi:hypothetical protein